MFRFMHVADLHFGKELHGVELVKEDQPFWVERFLEAIDEEKPDAVVIAGDVYDTRNPDQEAILLFEHLIMELAKRELYVFIVPGNHDSHVRLSIHTSLLEDKKIYIARNVEREIRHISTQGDTPVTFWLLPYVYKKKVASLLDREDIETYDDALAALMAEQKVDTSGINVLVAHQNVIASSEDRPIAGGSETAIIGGVGEVLSARFEDFDYVALGHIHRAQKVGRETVRYAGCPMYYDFSEINREKGITMVTVKDDGTVESSFKEIFLPYYLYQADGTFDELKVKGAEWAEKARQESRELKEKGCPYEKKYYIKLIVKGDIPANGRDILENLWEHEILNIMQVRTENAADLSTYTPENLSGLDMTEQFANMYKLMDKEGREMNDLQRDILNKTLELRDESGVLYDENAKIPDEVSEELLKAIEEMLDKGEKA